MLKGFTAAKLNSKLPKTANILSDVISNHLDRNGSTQLSQFITLWDSEREVEDEIIRLRRKPKSPHVSVVGGLGNAYRLYEVDGKKLGLLKAKVVRVQDVVDREGWKRDDADDDEEHEDDGDTWYGARFRR
jgi:hypothetical protein